jgi:hypothetical protein
MTQDRIEWWVAVVDRKPWPRRGTAGALRDVAGVTVQQAARWAKARREMSPAGLKRKLKERVN